MESDESLRNLARKALKKADQHKGKIKDLWSDLTTMIRLVRAWAAHEYRVVPWKSIAIAVGAILYFVNPFDFIPDLLLLGFADDAVVIATAISSLKSDLEAFRAWEKTTLVLKKKA